MRDDTKKYLELRKRNKISFRSKKEITKKWGKLLQALAKT